jgi:hypothetical protein
VFYSLAAPTEVEATAWNAVRLLKIQPLPVGMVFVINDLIPSRNHHWFSRHGIHPKFLAQFPLT